MMTILIYAAISIVLVLIALTWAVLVRYLARRRKVVPELANMRFDLRRFFHADLPSVGDGANMRTTEGFVATMNKRKLDSIRRTRTVSREI